jgi:hypothetical protein
MPSPKTTTKPKRKPAKKKPKRKPAKKKTAVPDRDRVRVTIDLEPDTYKHLREVAFESKTRHTDFIRALLERELAGGTIVLNLPEEVTEAVKLSAATDFKEVTAFVREILVASLRQRGAL